MRKMDNKAQITIEYLIMLTLGIALAAVVVLLASNLFSLKDSIKENIAGIRNRVLGLK